MKTFTIADIRSWNPCYDPSRHLPEDWKGTALDLLTTSYLPDADKLWLCYRTEVMSERGLRLAAVDSARRAQTYPKNYTPDLRTLRAIDVAERFANGQATAGEVEEARRAAGDAAFYASTAATHATAAVTALIAGAASTAATYAVYAAHSANAAAAADTARKSERRLQVEYLIKTAKQNLIDYK